MKRLLFLASGLLIGFLIGCSTAPPTSGGGHEGEARIAGRVAYAGSGAVPWGAAVYLRLALYTRDTSAATSPRTPEAVVDVNGAFSIDSVHTGAEYTIEVNDGRQSGTCIRFAVPKDSSEINLPCDTLRPTGAIRGRLILDTAASSPVYIQVYGLDRTVKVDERTDSFTIDDLPAGTYSLHILSAADRNSPENIDGVKVLSGMITSINLVFQRIDPLAPRVLRVRLNTSASGAATSADVYNFPLLVRLSADNFNFNEAKSDGGDIRFVKNNGAPLPFDIENWDAKLRQACIWVGVDTIFGNNSTQSFIMQWSGADSSAPPSGAVFDTGRGFLACYHLGGTLDDATPHGYDGIDSGSVDTAAGIIGRGRALNGSTQFFSAGDLPDRDQGTISCWLRPKATINGATAGTQGLWGKKESDFVNYTLSFGGTDFYLDGDESVAGKLISKLENPDTGFYLLSNTATFTAHAWYFVSWCWGNGGDSLYVNGSLEATIPRSQKLSGAGAETIGRSLYDQSTNIANGGPKYFNGTLDEFRIENVCRGAAWTKLCFMNQRADDKMVKVEE